MEKITITERIGSDSGMIMEKKMRKWLAPSMLAASFREPGILFSK